MLTPLKSTVEEDVMTIFRMLGYDVAYKKTLTGRSGVEHVIDIVVEKTEPPGSRMILIKCTTYEGKSSLRLDEIIQFWGRTYDIGAQGLIITTSKLTEDASRFADFYKIKVIETCGGVDLKNTLMKSQAKVFGSA